MAVDVVVHRDFDYRVGGGEDFGVKFLSFSTHNNTKRGVLLSEGDRIFLCCCCAKLWKES